MCAGKLPEPNCCTSLKSVFNRLLTHFTKRRPFDFFLMNSGVSTGVLAIFTSVGKKHSKDNRVILVLGLMRAALSLGQLRQITQSLRHLYVFSEKAVVYTTSDFAGCLLVGRWWWWWWGGGVLIPYSLYVEDKV